MAYFARLGIAIQRVLTDNGMSSDRDELLKLAGERKIERAACIRGCDRCVSA